MKYNNPIIPGFYPDPSICRVGEDYYLVTSSFEYFPGVPVFHSRDLVNWRQIGHCLTRESQLDLHKARSSGGIYAPTIRHHNGKFYMVTTNVSRWTNFIVSTEDPGGEWSDPVTFDGHGIDPSLLFDDDGKVYLTSCSNVQNELDVETGELLTEPRSVWEGSGGRYPEGPHLYKIDGTYYLMIAEGGTEYTHMETIARSSSPWGPFTPCPHNPILTHRSLLNPIQATGHADMIQAHDGSWWMVFLAFRMVGEKQYHHLGRETFLAPVSWTEDGWPVVNGTGSVALEMAADCLPPHPWDPEPRRDDFDSQELRLCWNFLRNPYEADWSLTDRPGWLRLNGSAVTLDDKDSPAFVGRRQQHFTCRATALLEFDSKQDGDEAGLTAIMNNSHHYEIAVTRLSGKRRIILRRRIGTLAAVVADQPLPDGPVTLHISADPDEYTFRCAAGDAEMTDLGKGETRYLSSEVAGGFTGVYLGMYAVGSGGSAGGPADFDWFEYVGED